MHLYDAHGAACEAAAACEEAMFAWEKKDPPPSPADEAALARWRRRIKAAERRTGFAAAKAKRDEVCDAAWEAREALRDTVPITFAGLAAKARATRYIEDEKLEGDLENSLLRDIAVMAGARQTQL